MWYNALSMSVQTQRGKSAMDADEVVRTYSDMVYRIALGYAKNKEDAEDDIAARIRRNVSNYLMSKRVDE